MRTLWTFLGTGRYETVTYVWQRAEGEKTCTTRLFPEAAVEFFQPERVLLCATDEVRTGQGKPHFEELTQRLGERLQVVEIPDGKSETELWEIFDRIVNTVDENEALILDITHAFRSIPTVVFAVIAYLRRTKNVKVERIVYGAYEARQPLRNPPQPEDRAPVFDLTLLLDLMDWLSGAEALLDRGDAQVLAQRMEETHRRLWKERAAEELPQKLQNVANKLKSLSQALHLSRPGDVLRIAHELQPMLDMAREEFQRWAKPFAVIVKKIQDEIAPLAYKQPERLDPGNLRRQLALIEYYLGRHLTVQAVTLAREWVVSRAILQQGRGDWRNSTEREETEKALGAAVQKWCRGDTSADIPEWLEGWPLAKTAAQTWDWLAQLRNDVAHCGMRSGAASAESIAQRAREIPDHLRALLDEASEGILWSGRVVIDLKALYGEIAKLDELPLYLERARELAGEGQEVVLTGQAPIWLYLAVAHALHGKARRLWYDSPVTGEVLIFEHSVR